MKLERISIFNYEAFYLDHLEGNLGDEDTALLLAFLEENPELKMDDEELPIFDVDDYHLTATEKLELKQSDEDEVILLNNAEYFMISETEGLLSEQKVSELDVLVSQNPELEKDRAYFGAVTMKPDLSIVYDNKEGLKRKVVVLWPYLGMAAAASVLIAFFLLTNNQLEESSLTADKEKLEEKQDKKTDQNILREEKSPSQIAEEKSDNSTNPPNVINVDESTIQREHPKPQNNRGERATIASLEKRDIQTLVHSLEGFELQPISATLPNVSENNTSTGSDVASTGYEHMTDPIQGVTARINKRIKPEVEFRTAKPTDTQNGGFFLKVGRFEFLRKKSK